MPDNPDIPQGTATQKKCRQVQVDRASLTKKLGPGLITGAADDDPSGIATYS